MPDSIELDQPIRLVFAEHCPQHPTQEIRAVTRKAVEWKGATQWLVTAEYACGHRHTQLAAVPCDAVEDTSGARRPVDDAED